MVLEAAINGNADALVTFNQRDFCDAPGTIRNRDVVAARSSEENMGMKKQKRTYPLRLPGLPEGGRCQDQQGRRDKYQSVCDDDGCREKWSAMKTTEFLAMRAAEADLDAARRLLRRDGGQPPAPDDRLP